jgi:hypothetical protein
MTRTSHLCTLLIALVGALVACGGDGGPSFSSEHPRILLPGARDRLVARLESPEGKRYLAAVDRWVGGREIWGFDAWNAALVGQLTGDPKYCAAAVAAVDKQVTEATAAIAAGDEPPVAGDSYLGVGDLIGDLALVYDWCTAEVGGRRDAWLGYAHQVVWNVWNFRDATYGGRDAEWSGWATDNPSNNYHYSFLRATMLLGLAAYDDFPTANNWRTEFHDRHILEEVVPTFDTDLAGGGSREGTGYGASMRRLFELYRMWEASTGENLANLTTHTRASMLAFMHQIVPSLDRIAPTGDQSRDSEALFFDYHRAYLLELIALYPSDPVAPRVQALLDASSVPKMENEFMFASDFFAEQIAAGSLDGLGTAYHAPGIGQLYARSSWDKSATWLNLIAGPYTESHAHQDQGSLMIYKEGWLVYDANVESQSGLHQETEAHSLVRIVDGGQTVRQRTNTASRLVALHRGPGWLHAAADITPAYKGNAAVQKVEREIVLVEPDAIVVYDRVTTRAGTQQIWQLATPALPALAGAVASLGALTVQRVEPLGATSSVHTFGDDFRAGYRLDTTTAGGDQRYLHVLWHGVAVGGVTPITNGATLALAGGGVATVQFSRDAIGGSITIGGTTTPLGPGLDALPE